MSSFGLSSQRRRLALSVGGALAAAVIAAPCRVGPLHARRPARAGLAPGQGATFQNNAFNGFKAVFGTVSDGCGTAAGREHHLDGHRFRRGAHRARPERRRHQPAQRARLRLPLGRCRRAAERRPARQMEAGPIDANGQDVTAADNAKLHVIPVAIGAITVIVHLPDGVHRVRHRRAALQRSPEGQLAALEAAFYGAASPTWGDLMPNLAPRRGCADQPIMRGVRRDSSGSTFAFKQLLAQHQLRRTRPNGARQATPQWPTVRQPGQDPDGRRRRRARQPRPRQRRLPRLRRSRHRTRDVGQSVPLRHRCRADRQDLLAPAAADAGRPDLHRPADRRQRLQDRRRPGQRQGRQLHTSPRTPPRRLRPAT